MKGTPNHLLLAIGIAPCLAISFGALLIVPQFNEVFVNFAAPLPLATHILLATFRWWGVSALITVALWFFWPAEANRGVVAVTFGVVSSAVLFAFGLYACYAPVFFLASVSS